MTASPATLRSARLVAVITATLVVIALVSATFPRYRTSQRAYHPHQGQTRSSGIPTLTMRPEAWGLRRCPLRLASPLYNPTITLTVILARINSLLSSSCPALTLLPHRPRPHPPPNSGSLKPWIHSKTAQKRICVIIHSPSSCKTANLQMPFLLFLNSN